LWLVRRPGLDADQADTSGEKGRVVIVPRVTSAAIVARLAELSGVIGTGEEPDGLCANREDHAPHLHDSPTLGRFEL
jgi:hypothetical protein